MCVCVCNSSIHHGKRTLGRRNAGRQSNQIIHESNNYFYDTVVILLVLTFFELNKAKCFTVINRLEEENDRIMMSN